MVQTVALLGLSCAFNPVLIGVVLFTLASTRPKRMLGAYVAGAMTWSVGLGIGAVAVASSTGVFKSKSSSSRPIFDLVVGVVLLAGAAWCATGRAEQLKARRAARAAARPTAGPHKPPLSERLLSGRVGLAFLAGVLMNFPSVRYIAALKNIAAANVSQTQEILAVLLFNVLMLSPALIPLALLTVRPEQTRAVITRANAWMRAHSRVLLSVILGVIGLYLTVSGISALA